MMPVLTGDTWFEVTHIFLYFILQLPSCYKCVLFFTKYIKHMTI